MTDLSAEHLADVLRRVVHSAQDLEQNVFVGLTRREFDQKLQQLLYTSFNFPRSFDEAFHDPGLMLIASGVCFAVAAIVVLVILSTLAGVVVLAAAVPVVEDGAVVLVHRHARRTEADDYQPDVQAEVFRPRHVAGLR